MFSMSTQFTAPLVLEHAPGTTFQVKVASVLAYRKLDAAQVGTDGITWEKYVDGLLSELEKLVVSITPKPEGETIKDQLGNLFSEEELRDFAITILGTNRLRYEEIKKSKSLQTSAPADSTVQAPATLPQP